MQIKTELDHESDICGNIDDVRPMRYEMGRRRGGGAGAVKFNHTQSFCEESDETSRYFRQNCSGVLSLTRWKDAAYLNRGLQTVSTPNATIPCLKSKYSTSTSV
jgi:hypothetical protein